MELLELQPAGKKRMSVDAFVNGYHPESGEMLAMESGSEMKK